MTIKIKLLRTAKDDEKLAKTPQVKIILEVLGEYGIGHEVERTTLIEKIDKHTGFQSRQGAAKVLNFYQPKLISEGLIEKIGTEPKKEKAEGDKKTEGGKAETAAAGEGEAKKPSGKKGHEAKETAAA